ncbi:MAG: NAD(P)H-hydrate dehydratase, partial [Candidatus Micrarchaeota archaeon]|nr:NAD(P)H-hydrate dehydratase [Candidatus Micrarchaeota archaeon]
MHTLHGLKEFAKFTKQVLTIEEMRAVDMNTTALGVSQNELMDNAGRAVAEFVSKKFTGEKRILIVCGRGKNGGDGFTAAKHLCKKYDVKVALLGNREEINPDSKFHLNSISQIPTIAIIENAEQLITQLLGECDVVIDAIFGTGFHGKMREGASNAIDAINSSKKVVVAVDVPSGLTEDGQNKKIVNADYTLTYHKMKAQLVRNRSAGKVIVVAVGIPIDAEIIAGPGDLYLASVPRGKYSSKKENGKAVIIGGSKNIHGAPSLASNSAYSTLAALRVGIGYTITCVPRSIANIVRKVSPNIIVIETESQDISTADLPILQRAAKSADSVVIGPGLGRAQESLAAAASLVAYLSKLGKMLVVDADAIYSINSSIKLGSKTILTPNDKEFSHLSSTKMRKGNLKSRIRAAVRAANHFGTNILLKGHQTIVTDGKVVKIILSNSSALATMGTGDVLSGIIAGYAARKKDMLISATAGAYLHARIGDELYVDEGTHILASDIIERIPKIIKEFDKNVI